LFAGGCTTHFFLGPRLPHKCGVPVGFGRLHLCGSHEFYRAPVAGLFTFTAACASWCCRPPYEMFITTAFVSV
jgi:hypothetical protein